MSKSRRNTVDPSDIIESYGADTARWFMLSDSPPERDVNWTEEGVNGAWRFMQRVWRLIGDSSDVIAPTGVALPESLSDRSIALRRAAHKALDAVDTDLRRLRFNRAVAAIYELTNTLTTAVAEARAGKDATPDMGVTLREAVEILVRLMAPMMPHLAEECWRALGHESLVAEQLWPAVDRDMLVEDSITIAVQVNGKRRDELTISRNAAKEEVEKAALALPNVARALDGKPVRKVIVVPQRIVNVVA